MSTEPRQLKRGRRLSRDAKSLAPSPPHGLQMPLTDRVMERRSAMVQTSFVTAAASDSLLLLGTSVAIKA